MTPCDLAIRVPGDRPAAEVRRRAAGPAACGEIELEEDPVITRIADLFDFGMEALPGFQEFLEPLAHLSSPAVDPSESRQHVAGLLPFNVRGDKSDERVSVTSVQSIHPCPHDLNVLLRHRPRSIA